MFRMLKTRAKTYSPISIVLKILIFYYLFSLILSQSDDSLHVNCMIESSWIGHTMSEVKRMENRQGIKPELQQGGLFLRTLFIGFVGGVLGSALLAFAYYFSFVEAAPKSYLLKTWLEAAWVDRLSGHLVAIFISGLLSMIPAVVYFLLFRKINSMWAGIFFGIFLWVVLFFVFQPLIPTVKPIFEQKADTWITTLCTFVLYGLFVGYSISFDFYEMKRTAREQGDQ